MARLLRWFYRWLVIRFSGNHSDQSEHDLFEIDGALALAPIIPDPVPDLLPLEPVEESAWCVPDDATDRKTASFADEDLSITWHFRSTILDRLDEYFPCLRRLKTYAPDDYALFARVGFSIPADLYANPRHENTVERLRTATRLSFGGLLMGGIGELHPDKCYPSFIYFSKLTQPSQVQVAGGDIYRLTLLWDKRSRGAQWRSEFTMPEACHLAVTTDGQVALLRERVAHSREITRRAGHRKETLRLTSAQWAYPNWIMEIAGEHKLDPQQWAAGLFMLAFVTHLEATSRILIRTSRDDLTATFGIDLPRAKYFFADRQLDVASDGKRKRIFHSVVAHTRTLAEDRTTTVRAHYRGVRDFEWKTYRIHIVLPTNNFVVTDNSIAATVRQDIDPAERRRFMGSRGYGASLAQVLTR